MFMVDNLYPVKPGTVYIVGAGPGAPDLIAVRGRDIIAQADLIIYADSLVEQSVAELSRKENVQIVASSSLYLEEIMDLMVDAAKDGQVVARIHSGDPALYGATHEQMAHLEGHKIPYEIVPGITAAFAAAAILQTELTVPDVVQTIILTRTAGRTTMPLGEELRSLAAPGVSLAIYLSVTRIRQVVDDLIASGGYDATSPVAVLHKVTWPDESYVVGTLNDIVDKVRAAKYTKHALILVSPALDHNLRRLDRLTSSHLYDKSYSHRFRRAVDPQRTKERVEAREDASTVRGDKHLGSAQTRVGTAVVSVTKEGSSLARDLSDQLQARCAVPSKFVLGHEADEWPSTHLENNAKNESFTGSVVTKVRDLWAEQIAHLILIMPTGIAVRAIAPLLTNKYADPAVICLDEQGHFVVPLVGGHLAGANHLAQQIAALTKGHAVITTASDVQNKPALDLLGQEQFWRISPDSAVTVTSAALVNGESIGVWVDVLSSASTQVEEILQPLFATDCQVERVNSLDELDSDTYVAGLIVSDKILGDHHKHLLQKSILYRPPTFVVGMGCMAGVPRDELMTALRTSLSQVGLAHESAGSLATADLKAAEPGMIQLAAALNVPFCTVSTKELRQLHGREFTPSAAQKKFAIPGVAEPCARVISGGGELLLPKQAFKRCTVAIASINPNAESIARRASKST